MEKNSSPAGTSGKQKVRSAEVGTDILKALAELSPATSLSRLAERTFCLPEVPAGLLFYRYPQGPRRTLPGDLAVAPGGADLLLAGGSGGTAVLFHGRGFLRAGPTL